MMMGVELRGPMSPTANDSGPSAACPGSTTVVATGTAKWVRTSRGAASRPLLGNRSRSQVGCSTARASLA